MKDCSTCYWGVKDKNNPGNYLCLVNDGQHALKVRNPKLWEEPCHDYEEEK